MKLTMLLIACSALIIAAVSDPILDGSNIITTMLLCTILIIGAMPKEKS